MKLLIRSGRIFCAILSIFVLMETGCRKTDTPSAIPPVVQTKAGEMVRILGGEFEMGSSREGSDEGPVHRILVDAFLIDRLEVTQEQFQILMGKNPSRFKAAKNPVEQLSWGEAALYCNARSRSEGFRPCYDETSGACDFIANGYRLPTEAEWEYACRAGTSSDYSFKSAARIKDYAWFAENSSKTAHPVGQKLPNPWGLYDMHGNVMEWCNDVYEKNYYAQAPSKNPHGPVESQTSKFVLRGGCWNNRAQNCRSASRVGESPGQADACTMHPDIGFRCVRSAPVNDSGKK
ncbi:MAG: formylglycine-generating enzyme family protein [Kiritimatiellae bacterium]|nr:formylglycine-generating enzyme family protein [Kiritimatiellia bacterium]MDD5519242.1 formylglycine-generating enzyme family protein [Kiritimatiellia bacterium]